jgi:hypothetical protein
MADIEVEPNSNRERIRRVTQVVQACRGKVEEETLNAER